MDKPAVVCFGDSITYGQGLDDPTRDAYPAVLERLLGQPVLNRGYCGDTTRIALERFPRDVQQSGAAVVVVQFGHNDCNRWASDRGHPRVSLQAFRANLEEMEMRAWAFGMRCVFLAPHATAKSRDYESLRGDYVRAIRKDILPRFVYPHPVPLLDHIHPNESGHLVIAKALLPHLEAAA